jgi:hypothetical protein
LFRLIRHPLIIAPIGAQRQALLTERLPFGGPPANNNARHSGPNIIVLVGLALSVVAVLGFGAIGIAMVHIADSKHPVTPMPDSLPGIAVEAPGRATPSDRPMDCPTDRSRCRSPSAVDF